MTGMIVSVVVMCLIYWPANIPVTRDWWMRTFKGEIFWPWFTLIGTVVTLGTAWAVSLLTRPPVPSTPRQAHAPSGTTRPS
jgi:hypothetical protein